MQTTTMSLMFPRWLDMLRLMKESDVGEKGAEEKVFWAAFWYTNFDILTGYDGLMTIFQSKQHTLKQQTSLLW